ncbi:MAG: 16S rRNA (adenine(1518)-N(6)/adenine(1519)-N(6))-dimethyltransferase RsmA [Spirochaetaceae bacterium]|nr:16S rRNA (adenine(1518)-N(6)/adenine(1519)-N(6))-dimethyltransferase RsmA [Spirochaetaceae bacterium]
MQNFLDYDSPAAINAFLRERGLAAQKKFGQNFLIRRRAREKLVEALSPPEGSLVWEIGAGLGAMTAILLDRGACVKAFEIDRGFCGVLAELFSNVKNFSLVEGDALETWKGEGGAEFLAGNLPYNIAARLMGGFIESGVFFRRMVVTVQREVARRMAAKPGSPDYSSFSVLCSSVYTVRPVITLKGDCFFPAPNVESEGLCLELKDATNREGYTPLFYSTVRALFASRRKTLKNNLLAFVKLRAAKDGIAAEELCASLLRTAGLHPGERAENLACEDFLRLSTTLTCYLR